VTPEDVVNNALDLLARPRIGSFYDGTPESIVALDIWSHTRDMLLMTAQPVWSKKDIVLSLLTSAPNIANGTANYSATPWTPAYPPLPWLFQYAYPADCLLPLQIKVSPTLLPIWRGRAKPFRPAFDAITGNHVILTNEVGAILIYIAQILDPNDWYQDFTELMIEALAKKLDTELRHQMPQHPPRQESETGSNPPG
jgi:hypothetical protein